MTYREAVDLEDHDLCAITNRIVSGAQANRPTADIEQLIPRLTEDIERAVETLPKTLAAGNVELARQELKGFLGSIRVVAEPTRMLLYCERGFVEPALKRAVWQVLLVAGA